MNTYCNLQYIYCNNLYIIHSKEDERIPYKMAIKNYSANSNYIKNKIFIDIKGLHKDLIFDKDIKL